MRPTDRQVQLRRPVVLGAPSAFKAENKTSRAQGIELIEDRLWHRYPFESSGRIMRNEKAAGARIDCRTRRVRGLGKREMGHG